MFNALQTPAPQRAGSTELTGCWVRCFRPRQQNQTDAITAWRVVVALLFNLAVKNSQKSFPSGMFVVLTFSLYLASPLVPVFFFKARGPNVAIDSSSATGSNLLPATRP